MYSQRKNMCHLLYSALPEDATTTNYQNGTRRHLLAKHVSQKRGSVQNLKPPNTPYGADMELYNTL